MRRTLIVALLAAAAVVAAAPLWAGKKDDKKDEAKKEEPKKEEPKAAPAGGLKELALPVPADNAIAPGKAKLGEQLFFDKRLSKSKKTSCETCHVPEKGWTDGLALSTKDDGTVNVRHSPTLLGAAYAKDLYWDGRAAGLEAQVLAAWKGQMSADPDAIAKELAAIPAYKKQFEAELGGPPTGDLVVKALATFVRTISSDTPWDRMDQAARDKSAAGRGFKVLTEAKCVVCHVPPLFSDTQFHNIGIGAGKEKPDLGRGKILADAATKAGKTPGPAEEAMNGAFKTPSLRGVAASGPYFHDGSANKLEEAVDVMVNGGPVKPKDPLWQAAKLTPAQRGDLLEFLRALTPDGTYARPTLP